MRPRTTGVGEKEQNGDVEALNGALKRDLEQQLLLRGQPRLREPRGVPGLAGAGAAPTQRACGSRASREERAALGRLAATRLPSLHGAHGARGTGEHAERARAPVLGALAAERGAGHRAGLRDARSRCCYGGTVELDVERLQRQGRAPDRLPARDRGLVRKPGALRRYRYREELFPTQTFRRAYERLTADHSEWAADVEYLRILHLAAMTMECEVEAALDALLEAGTRPTLDLVRARVAPDDGHDAVARGARGGPGCVRPAARGLGGEGGMTTTLATDATARARRAAARAEAPVLHDAATRRRPRGRRPRAGASSATCASWPSRR